MSSSNATNSNVAKNEPKPMTPRARAKRNQIRTAAQQLFLRNGFAGTSTDAIASEAGVSKQTLYAYYPSKEDLLADVLKQLIHQFADAYPLDEPAQQPPGSRTALAATLNELAQGIVATLMQPDYLALVSVMIAELPRFPHLGTLFRRAVPEQVLGRVANVLEQAQAQKLVRPLDTHLAAQLFVGPLLVEVLLNGLLSAGAPQQPSPQRVAALVDLYLHAIVA